MLEIFIQFTPSSCQHVFCVCIGLSPFLAFADVLCSVCVPIVRTAFRSLVSEVIRCSLLFCFVLEIFSRLLPLLNSPPLCSIIMANHMATQHDFTQLPLQSSVEIPFPLDLLSSVTEYSLVKDHFLGIHCQILPHGELQLPSHRSSISSFIPRWCRRFNTGFRHGSELLRTIRLDFKHPYLLTLIGMLTLSKAPLNWAF